MERNSIKLQDNNDNDQLRLHFYCANPDPVIVDGNFKTIIEKPVPEKIHKSSTDPYDIISELAAEKNSEKEIDEFGIARKMAARAILTAFSELGDYSKDRSLLKKMDTNVKLREKYPPEFVRKNMKMHLENANNIFPQQRDMIKEILGIDFADFNESDDSEKMFNCAIRRKYFPEEHDIRADDEREAARKALNIILNQD